MKLEQIITENFQTVSINGILYSLNTDEKAIYDKIKKEENKKLFKKDLDEFSQRIASGLVTKGILQRRKNPQHEIYFTTRGRRKNAVFNRPLEEVAPPDIASEKWINKNKEKFKEKYGSNYKKYLYGKAWNMYNGKGLSESYNVLLEGITELQKYFPKIPLKRIQELVALDPTYKGGNELGTYGKWILKLVNNNLKNEENIKQFEELKKKYPDGINPKSGQPFMQPKLLPAIKDEDLYKITDSLKQYNINKKEIGKPIDSFQTLQDLDKELSTIKQSGIPTNELALKRYNIAKKGVEKGFKIVYEDANWLVGIPTTKESSCLFGDDTSWCTTSPGQSYYEHYTKDGPLYINLNKNTGQLYQFHFETDSFMDEHDNEVNILKLSRKFSNDLVKFYDNVVKNGINNNKTKDKFIQYRYLFNDDDFENDDLEDYKETLKSRPYSIQYIRNPTQELIDIAIQVSPSVIKYIEHPTQEQIDLYIKENPREAIHFMDTFSDEKLLEIIKERNDLFKYFYNKDVSRFTPDLFNKALDVLDLTKDDDILNTNFSEKDVFTIVNKFFNIKNTDYYSKKNLKLCVRLSKIDINNVPEDMRYKLLVIYPKLFENLNEIREIDMQALVDTAKNQYNIGDTSDLEINSNIKTISKKCINLLFKYVKIIIQKGFSVYISSFYEFFSVEDAIKFIKILPGNLTNIVYSFVEDTDKFISLINTLFTSEFDFIKSNYVNNGLLNRLRNLILNDILPVYNRLDEDAKNNILEVFIDNMVSKEHKYSRDYKLLKRFNIDIPYKLQKKIAVLSPESVVGIKNLDIRLQKALIEKNPFNIKFINNPDAEIIKMAYEKDPDTKNYIR